MPGNCTCLVTAVLPGTALHCSIHTYIHTYMQTALMDAQILYKIIGGLKFYERREVKDVLGYLRLLTNPRDLVAARRTINTPLRGIGAVTQDAFFRWVQHEELRAEQQCHVAPTL